MDTILRCECRITQHGEYIVAERCRNCKECNTVSRLHPFGNDRIAEISLL